MTSPDRPRPVPGPAAPRPPEPDTGDTLAGLVARPLAEHVAVFEAEHARLQRRLSTIDHL